MSRREATILLALFMAVLAVVWCVARKNQSGFFSYRNYERIKEGMDLDQVQTLLGAPGEEISFDQIPGVPPHSKLPKAPEGWLGVVWGERCFRWWDGERRGLGDPHILVGVSGGRVVSKYFIEYDL